MSGKKFDNDKVPLDLIPADALFEIGRVLQAGAKKYERANWTKGIEMSRLISAAMRHILQFNDGQDKDIECDTNHLANAAVNLMFALWMYKNRPDLDDRWAVKKEVIEDDLEYVSPTPKSTKTTQGIFKEIAITPKDYENMIESSKKNMKLLNEIQTMPFPKSIQEENMKDLYSQVVNIEDNSPYAKVAKGMAKFNKEKT